MNPFNVSRFTTVNINTKFLTNIPGGIDRSEFLSTVLTTIRSKFANVNIRTVVDGNPTGLGVKNIVLHDNPNIDFSLGSEPSALGVALRSDEIAEVNIADIVNGVEGLAQINPQDFSEAVGTVVSHEMGHLFLPGGHSASGSIMDSGPNIANELLNGGDSLVFSGLQENLMNLTVASQGDKEFLSVLDHMDLGEFEHAVDMLSSTSGISSVDTTIGLDLFNTDASQQLDSSLWGEFDPSIMDSVNSLGDLSEFGELASNFDLSALIAPGADGVASMLSDLGGIEELADASSEGFSALFGDLDGDGIMEIGGELFEKLREILSFLPF